jgi:hypothetical protein
MKHVLQSIHLSSLGDSSFSKVHDTDLSPNKQYYMSRLRYGLKLETPRLCHILAYVIKSFYDDMS